MCLHVLGGEKKMKTKSLVIILVLAVLILTAGSVYPGSGPKEITFGSPAKAHPWEDLNYINGPVGSSAMILKEDYRVTIIPFFSDFWIWICIKDIRKGSDQQKNSIKVDERSYQIIFPW